MDNAQRHEEQWMMDKNDRKVEKSSEAKWGLWFKIYIQGPWKYEMFQD